MTKTADQIHAELRHRYADVARQPDGQFAYPVGRESVERLGYRPEFFGLIPIGVIDHFVGVGNPFSLGEPQLGESVLEIGCGAGFDSQIAARYVGASGKVIGVDMSDDMLAVVRQGASAPGLTNLEFRQGIAEKLPVESAWVDMAISNGVLNLATCKTTAFREAFRVLKSGGRFQAVDLVLTKELSEKFKTDKFAWSN